MTPSRQQTVLITGSTDGIGRITAGRLAETGAQVLVHGRSREKCERTVEEIRQETGNEAVAFYCRDLASLDEVRSLAADVRADHRRLDILINNAGVGLAKSMEDERPLSEDGYELCWAVNYLAPYVLTRRLLPLLEEGSPSRIVNVSSVAQKPLAFDDILLERSYSAYQAYAQSKLALIMFTFDLARELEGSGVTANCLHPGTLLDTNIVRESPYQPMGSAESGAEVEIYVATASELAGKTGLYFNEKSAAKAHEQAYDHESRQRLRRLTEELVG